MIEMNRNNVGLFRWDGCSSLRDAAPCDQSSNRHLRPDDGNRRIDGNMGRLVHSEILRHLRAIGACLGFRRRRGIPILFAGVNFIHGSHHQETTGQLTEERRIPPFYTKFFEERSRLSAGIDYFSLFRQDDRAAKPFPTTRSWRNRFVRD